MTKKEIFDIVSNHLLNQKERSIKDGYCSYRGERNLKCAIGCLIEDHEYSEDMEKHNVYTLKIKERLPERLVEHVSFLYTLQNIHDQEKVEDWDLKLKELSENLEKT